LRTGDENLKKTPRSVATGIHTNYLKGIVVLEEQDRIIILLNLIKLFSEEEFSGLHKLGKSMKPSKPRVVKKKPAMSEEEIVEKMEEQKEEGELAREGKEIEESEEQEVEEHIEKKGIPEEKKEMPEETPSIKSDKKDYTMPSKEEVEEVLAGQSPAGTPTSKS